MQRVVDAIQSVLNDNRYMAGIAMILFTIGSKYLKFDLNKNTKRMLNSKTFKNMTIFSIFYIGSRDIFASIILTIAFVIIVDGLLNEKSRYCILPDLIKDKIIYSKKDYETSKEFVLDYEKHHDLPRDKRFCSLTKEFSE